MGKEPNDLTTERFKLGVDADGVTHYHAPGGYYAHEDDGRVVTRQMDATPAEFIEHVGEWRTLNYSDTDLAMFVGNRILEAARRTV